MIEAARIPKPTEEYRFVPGRRWRFDLAWPDRRLFVEIDGGIWINGRHVRGSGWIQDAAKFNRAAIMGWRGLHVTPDQVRSGEALRLIKELFGELPSTADQKEDHNGNTNYAR
ncbi:MAG: hypothetical protein QXZ09_06050 [Candidatus Methanomethylicaceae archaeon]